LARRTKRYMFLGVFAAFLLLIVGFLLYQQLPGGVVAGRESPDSENCYNCHSNPEMIEELAVIPEEAAAGG